MALSRRTDGDAQQMRDRFIEVSAEALAALDYEAARRDAYLEGFAICRALETLEDLEIVLAMRWGGDGDDINPGQAQAPPAFNFVCSN
jgi:hypothetical protein